MSARKLKRLAVAWPPSNRQLRRRQVKVRGPARTEECIGRPRHLRELIAGGTGLMKWPEEESD